MEGTINPLPNWVFMLSILGMIITGIFTGSGRVNTTWGFTVLLFFIILFIASVVSLTPQEKEKYKKRK